MILNNIEEFKKNLVAVGELWYIRELRQRVAGLISLCVCCTVCVGRKRDESRVRYCQKRH